MLVLLLLLLSPVALSLKCTKDPSSTCKCALEDGRVLDLSPAASSDPSKPRYSKTVKSAGSDEVFLFNPCKGFSCSTGGGDNKAAVCDTIPDVSYYQVTGTQDSVQFDYSNNVLKMQFSSQNTYTSTITLVCSDQAGYGTFDMSANGLSMTGTLTSQYACFRSSGSSSSSGLSLGDILLIVFFSSLALYLILGILFQAFVRKQRGIDLVPNRSFWTSMPGNVKSGGQFVVAKVKGRKNSSYSDI